MAQGFDDARYGFVYLPIDVWPSLSASEADGVLLRVMSTLDAKEVPGLNDDVEAVRTAIGATEWQTARRRSSV